MYVCNFLKNLEMDLLVMFILIMLAIWISGGISSVMFSSLVFVLLAVK